jgi:hypothetical protein
MLSYCQACAAVTSLHSPPSAIGLIYSRCIGFKIPTTSVQEAERCTVACAPEKASSFCSADVTVRTLK